MPGPPPGWTPIGSGAPAAGAAMPAPSVAPAPMTQPGQQGQAPTMQLQGANIKGLQLRNTGVPTEPNLSKFQQDAQLTEELSTMLNDYKTALDADTQRKTGVKDIDKAVQLMQNAPMLSTAEDSLKNRWDYWKYDPTIMGHEIHQGLGSDRSHLIFLAARLRSRLTPETLKNTSVRAYKMIENVQEHYPYATDSNKEAYQKLNDWQQTINDARQQLQEMGIPVKAGAPVMAPPQNVSPASTGRPAVASSPPPFTPTRSIGDTLETKRLQDKAGHWWYYDIERQKWQQYGG